MIKISEADRDGWWLRTVLIVCLLPLMMAGSGGGYEYSIEWRLLAIPISDTNLVTAFCVEGEKRIPLERIDEKSPIRIKKLELDGMVISFGDNELFASCPSGSMPSIDSMTITHPLLATSSNDWVETNHSINDLQYLEKRKNGDFAIKSLDENESPGYFLKLRIIDGHPEPGSTTREDVEIGYDMAIKFMVGRSAIEGVTLEAGKPIIVSKVFQGRVAVDLDRWQLISIHLFRSEGASGNYLLSAVKISRGR